MLPPSGEPCGKVLREDRATHRTEQERGEGITRVWRERKIGAAEIVRTRRLRLHCGIVPRAGQLVPRLDRVLTDNLREVVLQRKVLAGLISATHGAQPV